MSASHKHWFKRGAGGLGHLPQTWQGWASLSVFLALLTATVFVIGTFWGDHPQAQAVTFIVAAVEIMGFLRFVRAHSKTRD